MLENDRQRYAISPEKKKKSANKYYKNNKIRVLENMLKRTYGIDYKDWQKLWADQGNVCAGCGKDGHTKKRHHVDHDHKTGKVRGILCHYCNIALGQCFDDPKILRSLADYLEKQNGV